MKKRNIIKLKKFSSVKTKNLKNNKFYRINRFGKKYFNMVRFKRNFKTERFLNNAYHFKQKYVLLNRKEYPFKKIKEINKMKFYLKENYFHPLEKEKIDFDIYYKKSFLLKTNLSQVEINKNLKIDQKNNLIKTKKKKENKINFVLNDVTNLRLNLYSNNYKNIKNIFIYKKNILKKLKNNIKKINFLNKYLQNKLLYNNLNLKFSNITTNNQIFYNNVNLKKKKNDCNKNRLFMKNFFLTNINSIFDKFYSFYLTKFHFLINNNEIVVIYILNKFRQFLKNYFIENMLQNTRLKNFKNLSNLYFLSKRQSKFSYLLFENKPFFSKLEQNVVNRRKNLQLRLLKEFYPDNIFEISKRKRKPKIYRLTKQGFKNFNDNLSFINFKKKKANSYLIEKKNLFFNNLTKTKDINFNIKRISFDYYLQLPEIRRKFPHIKNLRTYLKITTPIIFGPNNYIKLKKRRFKKKKTNRKLLKFVSNDPIKTYRRQNLYLELTGINNVEIMKQDFEDGSKLL